MLAHFMEGSAKILLNQPPLAPGFVEGQRGRN